MSDNYLELNDEDFDNLKSNFKKKNEKKIKVKKNNDDFINKILDEGKKEINYSNTNKHKIINELKDKVKELDSSQNFNEEKFNNFF